MAQWIRAIERLPIVEVKPEGDNGFSDDEFYMLLDTEQPMKMFLDAETVLLYNDESTDPVNERVCTLLNIPTAKQLIDIIRANGKQPDAALLARNDNERAWEIRGNALLARVKAK